MTPLPCFIVCSQKTQKSRKKTNKEKKKIEKRGRGKDYLPSFVEELALDFFSPKKKAVLRSLKKKPSLALWKKKAF
jgi:hypothetical protein